MMQNAELQNQARALYAVKVRHTGQNAVLAGCFFSPFEAGFFFGTALLRYHIAELLLSYPKEPKLENPYEEVDKKVMEAKVYKIAVSDEEVASFSELLKKLSEQEKEEYLAYEKLFYKAEALNREKQVLNIAEWNSFVVGVMMAVEEHQAKNDSLLRNFSKAVEKSYKEAVKLAKGKRSK